MEKPIFANVCRLKVTSVRLGQKQSKCKIVKLYFRWVVKSYVSTAKLRRFGNADTNPEPLFEPVTWSGRQRVTSKDWRNGRNLRTRRKLF